MLQSVLVDEFTKKPNAKIRKYADVQMLYPDLSN